MRGNLGLARNMTIAAIRRHPVLDKAFQIFRRRLQGLGLLNGFPDWQKQAKSDLIWHEMLSSGTPGKKVLIATSLGSHLPAMQMETVLAVSLVLRGARVDALLCDGLLPACQLCEPRLFPDVNEFCSKGPQQSLCPDCFQPGRKAYQGLGINVLAYGDHVSEQERRQAAELAHELPYSEIEKYSRDGMRLGGHAMAGALRYFARATLEGEKCGERVLRRYLEAALLTAFALRKIITAGGYEVVVFHHGIYVPQGVVGEVARSLDVRVVNWNPAYRKDCFIFSHGDTYHHTLMSEPVSTWEDMPWDVDRESAIVDYLKSRWQGGNDWIRFTDRPFFEKDQILTEIGCNPERPIIGLLTNVLWDAQLHYPANAFPDMLEWLVFTVRYFEHRPDVQLVIRVHPAEIRGSVPTRQPVVAVMKELFPELPPNIFLVPPESDISTYVLAELCDSVLIYGTKTGVELTATGVPVVVAGEAWIRSKGITQDAQNPEHYLSLLDKLPAGSRLTEEVVSRARKYAYHFFFRRMIPVKVFTHHKGSPPFRYTDTSLEKLYPGRDAGLDCICKGILESTPFVFSA